LVCDLCGREGHGRGVKYGGASECLRYQACSDQCAFGLLDLAIKGLGGVLMVDYTAMEKQAVVDSREPLWDALVAVGEVGISVPDDLPLAVSVSTVFAQLSAEQIDSIIMAVWDALRASMQKQSARSDIPF
jgi:hypothetical protein